jgi:hypothetical protein
MIQRLIRGNTFYRDGLQTTHFIVTNYKWTSHQKPQNTIDMKTPNPLKQIKLTWFVLPIRHPKPHSMEMQAQFNYNKMREICNMREVEMQALFCQGIGQRIKH